MQITSSGSQEAEIRTRDQVMRLGADVVIGDFTIPGPGEYEVGGVMADVGRRTVRLATSELVLGYLTPGSPAAPTDHDLEELGAVDLAIIAVGGAGLALKDATAVASQLDTTLILVLPDSDATLASLRQAGMTIEAQPGAWKLTTAQVPTEGTKVVALGGDGRKGSDGVASA